MNAKNTIIADLLEQKLTGVQIAEKNQVTRQYVSLISVQIGVKPFRKPPKMYDPKPKKGKTTQFRKEAMDYAQNLGLKNPVQAYRMNRLSAKKRGIDFKLTFEQWWDLWKPFYHDRGIKKGMKQLCRTLDKGGYEIGNVRIDYVESNGHEKILSRLSKKGTRWMGGDHARTGTSNVIYENYSYQIKNLDSE